jgi:hypothetical protein
VKNATIVAYASLAVLIALYVVGAVSVPPGSLRHEVQTLPLWFPIVAGFQKRQTAKWAALPCFTVWLSLMIVIWLFLLGWTRMISGNFSLTEIAMTVVVGIGSIIGLIAAIRWKTAINAPAALALVVSFAALQLAALRLSFLPYIAHR